MLLPVLVALAFPAEADIEKAVPSHECPALFGESERSDERRSLREQRLEAVSRSENLLDIVHSDAGWQAPKPTRVPGLELVAVEEAAEDGERLARVRVGEVFSEACAPGEYLVRVDDGLGSDGSVLALVDEGMLAEHRGNLIFVPRFGTGAPPFRMIWRSPFALNITPGSTPNVGGGSSSAAKPTQPRSAGRDASPAQRARANAKAAAETRRTTARPTRPRG